MSASSLACEPPQALRKPRLVCPAGSLRALTLAVDAGADAVYMGLKDATNARNFAGLNFDLAQARDGIAYARSRGREVLMALNTFADARAPDRWFAAVDAAAGLVNPQIREHIFPDDLAHMLQHSGITDPDCRRISLGK